MSDFGAAPRMDWTLQARPHETPMFKWGLPLSPHLYQAFANSSVLPAFEVSLDRLLLQESQSVDRSWARKMSQQTDVCLYGRLLNFAGERAWTDAEYTRLAECVEEISPRWLAIAIGFNEHNGHALHNPLPVPKTPEMIGCIVEKLRHLKSICKRDISIVNVASMFRYSYETMTEVEFLSRLVDLSDCSLILDIPALYVSLYHRDQDFQTELLKCPINSVVSLRIGALALSTHGLVDAECGRLSMTHWGLLEDALSVLPANQHRAVFLKWFEPLVSEQDLVAEIIRGQSALKRLGEL